MQDNVSIDAVVDDEEGLPRHSDDQGSFPLSLVRQQSLEHGSNDPHQDFRLFWRVGEMVQKGRRGRKEIREKHMQRA